MVGYMVAVVAAALAVAGNALDLGHSQRRGVGIKVGSGWRKR